MSAPAQTAPETVSIAREIATAVKHTFIYGFGGLLIKGASFFLLPLYTHFLTPRDYGIFEVLELSVSLLGMLLNMGITAALLRYYGAAQTEAEKRRIVGSIFLFTLATAAAVLGAGLLSAKRATLLLLGPGVPASYLLLSFTAFLIAYVANVPYTALRAREASGTVVTVDTVTTIGLFALNIYLVAVAKLAVYGMLLGRLIVNCANVLVLVRWTRRELFGGLDWALLRGIMKFGAPLVFSNLTMFTLNFSDRFFLKHFDSLEVVGIYAVGYKFGYMLNFLIIQPFNMMWQARMYIVYRRADHRSVISRIFTFYSAVLIFAGLGMSVLGPDLMRWMVDSRYTRGGGVIAVISLSYVLLGAAYYLQLGMFVTSRTGLVGVVSAVAAVWNLGANYVLIPRFGMMGAAWATVLGFGAIAVGSWYGSERVCPLGLPVGRAVKALGLAAGIYWISLVLPETSVALALLFKVTLLAMFPVLLWAGGCFSKDELAMLGPLEAGARRLLRPAWLRT